MAFPTNPTNGQLYKDYRYNSSKGAWEKTSSQEWQGSEKHVSTAKPTSSDGKDGDLWFEVEA